MNEIDINRLSLSLSLYIYIYIGHGYDTRSIFKRGLTDLNSEFSFSYTSCLTKAEEPTIAGGRIIGFTPFPRVLVLCEIPSVSSRIWTRVAVSLSYDDNHNSTCTSLSLSLSLYIYMYIYNSVFIYLSQFLSFFLSYLFVYLPISVYFYLSLTKSTLILIISIYLSIYLRGSFNRFPDLFRTGI